MPLTGRDLRQERRLADITATALAAQMGISRQSLWVIEKSAQVDIGRVHQYLDALKTLRDGKPAAA